MLPSDELLIEQKFNLAFKAAVKLGEVFKNEAGLEMRGVEVELVRRPNLGIAKVMLKPYFELVG